MSHVDIDRKENGKKSSYGKTSDGKVFKIPETHDMISSLFDPRLPKSHLDVLTLIILILQSIPILIFKRKSLQIFYLSSFLFWRLSYNVGLGWILRRQSERKFLVRWVDSLGLFDPKVHPQLSRWLEAQLEFKMSTINDQKQVYRVNSHPLDYNVWLLFRQLVDIVLLSDFLSYFLLSYCSLKLPGQNQSWLRYLICWLIGSLLVGFNVWVKVNAHRIIHDFAWYWGDAFFLSIGDQLVFDGVFEMAPHPMYSIGYAGFYGASLITGSKLVFFISLLAHLCQFGFLIYFENPHIERTYGPQAQPLTSQQPVHRPKPRTPLRSTISINSPNQPGSSTFDQDHFLRSISNNDDTDNTPTRAQFLTRQELEYKLFRKKDMIGLYNFDGFRAVDLATLLLLLYSSLFLLIDNRYLSLIHAMAWRVWFSFGLGIRLNNQSRSNSILLHFLTRYPSYSITGDEENKDELVEDSFNNWKSIYNYSVMMTYVSFGVMAIKFYKIDENWDLFSELVRNTFGLCLISIHFWTAKSTLEVLGKFGWFYGDFFIEDLRAELSYVGIYRFLNNPERSMGGAGLIGMSLMSNNKVVVAMAFISIISHWWFLSKVESPHMRKVYGDRIRKEAGLTKVLKQGAKRLKSKTRQQLDPLLKLDSDSNTSLGLTATNNQALIVNSNAYEDREGGNTKGFEQRFKEVQGTFEFIYEEAIEALDEFLEKSAPRLSGVVRDTKVLLQQSGERLIMTRVANDLSSYDTSRYSLTIEESLYHPPRDQKTGGLMFHMGEPIRLRWRAPPNHSKADWIGCYRRGSNKSGLVTEVTSQGRWSGLRDEDWDGDMFIGKKNSEETLKGDAVSGLVEFKSGRLPWKEGVYEFRYHHDGKHNVMAATESIEIYVEKLPSECSDIREAEEKTRRLVGYGLGLDFKLIPKKLKKEIKKELKIRSEDLNMEVEEYLEEEDDKDKKHEENEENISKGNEEDVEEEDSFTIMSLEEAKRIKGLIEIGVGIELGIEILIEDAEIRNLTRRIMFVKSLLKPFN
ncbi:phosphatidylethanolamine N-methyltransferase [Phakopsora pachyrhizi]|nr:phosphatidylethanolamine N-methyltransferase [Phakopsora pachyrhizi]